MRTLLTILTALYLAGAGTSAKAADDIVVVELFTSQGCSSCPPADKMLAELGERDNVIALALHVDYWDYIGWKDKFAHSAFTKRQKRYAEAFGSNTIYTPQMVINGSRDVVGNRGMEVADMVREYAEKGMVVPLDLRLDGSSLSISAPAASGMKAADVILVRYTPSETVSIPRGENAGKALTYTHIVTEWRDIGDWNGRTALSKTVDVSGGSPVVVLVQAKNHGPILAAARLR
jgi:Uncharacterized secreted protein